MCFLCKIGIFAQFTEILKFDHNLFFLLFLCFVVWDPCICQNLRPFTEKLESNELSLCSGDEDLLFVRSIEGSSVML